MPFQLEFISEQATRGVRELQHVQCKHPPQCMTWAVSGFRISCFPCTNPPQRTIANHPFWNLKRKEKQHVKTTETKNKKPTNRKHIWNCMLHLERLDFWKCILGHFILFRVTASFKDILHCLEQENVFGMARNSFILNIAFRSNHVAVIWRIWRVFWRMFVLLKK